MKKCPTCQRTFEDSMRFCQSDGTPLVDDAPPVDPYKTMVASSGDISAAMGQGSPAGDTEGAMKVDEEVLQLPENDPKKTMYASEEEIRREMQALDEPVIDLPGIGTESPKSSEPSPNVPSYGDSSPASPPSPFSPSLNEPIANPTQDSPFTKTTPPIPSPFDNPKPSTYEPAREYKPVEPIGSPQANEFGSMSAGAGASVQNWEPAQPMAGGSVSPASGAPGGQSKTLAIISLVTGILSIFCCGWFVPGIAAIVMGFMARSKANNDPAHYGGAGLALGGIITGALSLILGLIVVVLYLMGFLTGIVNPNAF